MPFYLPLYNKLDSMMELKGQAVPSLPPAYEPVKDGPLNDFISKVRTNGLATSNMYTVEMAIPAVVQNKFGAFHDLRAVQLFCDSCQLPDQNINTSQTRTYGEVREMPYENLYGNINMTFLVDSDYRTKHFFDTWIQNITDPETRHINYYKDYTVPVIRITMFNRSGYETYRAALYECYPKQIQAVTVDNNAKEVVKVSVSMNYKYWRSAMRNEPVDHASLGDPTKIDYKGDIKATQPKKALDILKNQFQATFDKYQTMYNNTVDDVVGIASGIGDLF